MFKQIKKLAEKYKQVVKTAGLECHTCNGFGQIGSTPCETCKGSGFSPTAVTCPACKGQDDHCVKCNGRGMVDSAVL